MTTRVTKKQCQVLGSLNDEQFRGVARIAEEAAMSQRMVLDTLKAMPHSWVERTASGRYKITATGMNVLTNGSTLHNVRRHSDYYLSEEIILSSKSNSR